MWLTRELRYRCAPGAKRSGPKGVRDVHGVVNEIDNFADNSLRNVRP